MLQGGQWRVCGGLDFRGTWVQLVAGSHPRKWKSWDSCWNRILDLVNTFLTSKGPNWQGRGGTQASKSPSQCASKGILTLGMFSIISLFSLRAPEMSEIQFCMFNSACTREMEEWECSMTVEFNTLQSVWLKQNNHPCAQWLDVFLR